MKDITELIEMYLEYCKTQKELNSKTLKAYRIDLTQFSTITSFQFPITKEILSDYLSILHQNFQPKTIKRKIASVKAFFRFLEDEEIIEVNPFTKINIRFREPLRLPKTIPAPVIQTFLSALYQEKRFATLLLKADVDIRYIKKMPVHSSINTTEICILLYIPFKIILYFIT